MAKTEPHREVFLSRGMTLGEIKTILQHPHMPNRERAFFRALFETFFRPRELLMCDIEDYNRQTGELIARFTKSKYNPRTKRTHKALPKHMIISPTTMELFKAVISNRKKGPIFVNRKGDRCSLRWFEAKMDEVGLKLGIQKVTHITHTGRNHHLLTLKALREAGERFHDLRGGDTELSAKAAQHTMKVKEQNYKKLNWDEVHESLRKYHPAFTGEI